jgi:hypothetical protein
MSAGGSSYEHYGGGRPELVTISDMPMIFMDVVAALGVKMNKNML